MDINSSPSHRIPSSASWQRRGFSAAPRGSSPEPQPNELVGLPLPALPQISPCLETRMQRLAPSECPMAPNRLTEKKGCIKRCYKVRPSSAWAPPGRACVRQERSASQLGFLWLGPSGACGRRPLTRHTCSSSSALLGKQCRDERICLPWDPGAATHPPAPAPAPAPPRFFPGRCVPEASV